MKRIDRLVLGGFAGAWCASLLFFTGMYLVIHFFNRIPNLAEASRHFEAAGMTPIQGFCRYYALNLPFVLVEVQPFTVLMAAMWVVQQMSRRNELVPVLVAGVSFRRLALPLLVSGLLIALGFAAVREEALPLLTPERSRMDQLFKGREEDRLKNLPILEDGSGRLIVLQEYDVQSDTAYGLNIRTAGAPARKGAYAEAARFRESGPAGPGWYPVPGARVEGDAGADRPLPTDIRPADVEIEARRLLYMTIPDIRALRLRHPERQDLESLLHGHYAYPFRTIVLVLLGLPLVLRITRKSPYVAVGISLLLSMAFFACQSVVEELGRRGEILNPVLGAWLPIILFGGLAALLFETIST